MLANVIKTSVWVYVCGTLQRQRVGSKCGSYTAVFENDFMSSAYQKTGSISIFS